MKLNGWQRIGVVLSTIWYIGIFAMVLPSAMWLVDENRNKGSLRDVYPAIPKDHPSFVLFEPVTIPPQIHIEGLWSIVNPKTGEKIPLPPSPPEINEWEHAVTPHFDFRHLLQFLLVPLALWAMVILVEKIVRWVQAGFNLRKDT